MADGSQQQMDAIMQMIAASGAPKTAENLNRASLHMARGDDNALSPVFEKAMASAVASPTRRQAAQATAQRPTGPMPPYAEEGVAPPRPMPAYAEEGTAARLSPEAAAAKANSPLEAAVNAQVAQGIPPAQAQQVAQQVVGTRDNVQIDEFGQPMPATSSGSGAVLPLVATMLARRMGGSKADALSQRVAGTDTPNTTPVNRPLGPEAPAPAFGRRTDVAQPAAPATPMIEGPPRQLALPAPAARTAADAPAVIAMPRPPAPDVIQMPTPMGGSNAAIAARLQAYDAGKGMPAPQGDPVVAQVAKNNRSKSPRRAAVK